MTYINFKKWLIVGIVFFIHFFSIICTYTVQNEVVCKVISENKIWYKRLFLN